MVNCRNRIFELIAILPMTPINGRRPNYCKHRCQLPFECSAIAIPSIDKKNSSAERPCPALQRRHECLRCGERAAAVPEEVPADGGQRGNQGKLPTGWMLETNRKMDMDKHIHTHTSPTCPLPCPIHSKNAPASLVNLKSSEYLRKFGPKRFGTWWWLRAVKATFKCFGCNLFF